MSYLRFYIIFYTVLAGYVDNIKQSNDHIVLVHVPEMYDLTMASKYRYRKSQGHFKSVPRLFLIECAQPDFLGENLIILCFS